MEKDAAARREYETVLWQTGQIVNRDNLIKWTKSADQILASVKRFCHKAQQTLCGEL